MLYVFDWDGTLIDSTGKIVRCMHRAIEEVDLSQRSDEQVRNIIGLGLPEAIRELFPEISRQQLEALSASYSNHYREADQTPCQFYPHVESVLEKLREDGHQLAVATGKSRRGLERVLANLGLTSFFDASRCADETASKPDPLMLLQLLECLRVDVSAAVMVGDTEFDLAMAANAGMQSIGVSYGAHSRSRLQRHRPVLTIDCFSQILDWQSDAGGSICRK